MFKTAAICGICAVDDLPMREMHARLRSPANEFLEQPSALQRPALVISDARFSVLLAHRIQQHIHRHDPAVLCAEASHQLCESRMKLRSRHESMSEMRV